MKLEAAQEARIVSDICGLVGAGEANVPYDMILLVEVELDW